MPPVGSFSGQEVKVQKVGIFQLSNYRFSPFARHLANLAPEFKRREVQLELVVTTSDGLDVVPESVRTFLIGQRLKSLKGLPRHYLAIPDLVSYLRSEAPDALICRGISFAIPALVARWFCKTKPLIIMTVHSNLDHDIKNKVYRSAFLMRWLAQIALKYCDQTVPVSDGIGRSYASLAGAADKLTTIHNPVVSSELLQAADAHTDDPWLAKGRKFRTLVMVGRFSPEKDHLTTFRALSILRTTEDVRLLLIGGGPLESQLAQFCADVGLSEFVRFLGRLENPYSYMRKADGLVLSSTTEGLPGVLIQAMAVGCPVVATDCPSGPAEVLENGRWGPMAPVGDHVALASAIARMLSCPIEGTLLAKRAAAFSAEASVAKMLGLIEDLRGQAPGKNAVTRAARQR